VHIRAVPSPAGSLAAAASPAASPPSARPSVSAGSGRCPRGNGSRSAAPNITTITAIRTRLATDTSKIDQCTKEPGWFMLIARGRGVNEACLHVVLPKPGSQDVTSQCGVWSFRRGGRVGGNITGRGIGGRLAVCRMCGRGGGGPAPEQVAHAARAAAVFAGVAAAASGAGTRRAGGVGAGGLALADEVVAVPAGGGGLAARHPEAAAGAADP